MSGKSRQMNKGAMKVHLAYQAKRRAETAAAVADREASGRAPSCPACHGKHRAHTCAQRSSRTPAARGTAAATASRNAGLRSTQRNLRVQRNCRDEPSFRRRGAYS